MRRRRPLAAELNLIAAYTIPGAAGGTLEAGERGTAQRSASYPWRSSELTETLWTELTELTPTRCDDATPRHATLLYSTTAPRSRAVLRYTTTLHRAVPPRTPSTSPVNRKRGRGKGQEGAREQEPGMPSGAGPVARSLLMHKEKNHLVVVCKFYVCDHFQYRLHNATTFGLSETGRFGVGRGCSIFFYQGRRSDSPLERACHFFFDPG